MFGIDSAEFLLIVVVAVVVIGPKDLPRALYQVGKIVGQARGMARHFRAGFDAMIREAELEELQKQWARENERIMSQYPLSDVAAEMKPLADETAHPAAALPAPDAVPPVQNASADEPHAAPIEAAPVPEAAPVAPRDGSLA